MTYKCLTHNIAVTIENNVKKFTTPPGSWAGTPQCQLMSKTLQEGKFGNCVIVKEK